MDYDHRRVTALSERFLGHVMGMLTHIIRNGDPALNYPLIMLSFKIEEASSYHHAHLLHLQENHQMKKIVLVVPPEGLRVSVRTSNFHEALRSRVVT